MRNLPEANIVDTSAFLELQQKQEHHHDQQQQQQRDESDIPSQSPIPNKKFRATRESFCLRHHLVEFGVTGVEQEDETHFDRRRDTSIQQAIESSNLLSAAIVSDDEDDKKDTNDDLDTSYRNGKVQQNERGRIQFSKQKLYGRDKELKVFHLHLESCFCSSPIVKQNTAGSPTSPNEARLSSSLSSSSNAVRSQFVLLSGFSGSGKSRLAQEAVYEWIQKKPTMVPIYIQGKYDEFNKTPDPYSGIGQAFGDWCKSLSKDNKQVLQDCQARLQETVGSDAEILLDLIPNLWQILSRDDHSTSAGNSGGGIDDGPSICSSTKRRRQQQLRSDNSSNDSIVGDGADGINNRNSTNAMNKDRIYFVMHEFFKFFCNDPETPLILFLDDLQWADSDTLDLIFSILQDSMNIPYFFFVGAYRSNELDTQQHSNQPLAMFLDKLKEYQKLQLRRKNNEASVEQAPSAATNDCFRPQNRNIELSDVSRDTINEFVADTLQLDKAAAKPLSDAIYSRTFGNMFFTMQALEQLVRENALYYDMISFQWSWVLPQNQLEELLSIEVIDMVKSKIKHNIPQKVQKLLIMASYTKSTFDVGLLRELLNRDRKDSITWTTRGLTKTLNIAVDEGLLIRHQYYKKEEKAVSTSSLSSTSPTNNHQDAGDGGDKGRSTMNGPSLEYSFAHDRIREAATTLVDGFPRDEILHHIGSVLSEWGFSETHGKEWMILTALHHLTSIPDHYHESTEAKLELAKLCLEAGALSHMKAAFQNAADYAKQGIEQWLLPLQTMDTNNGNIWKRYPSLCRDLYILAAEAYREVGDIPTMTKYCEDFLSAQGKEPMDVKFAIYETLAQGIFFSDNDRQQEAMDIVLNLLKHLNCRFPKGTFMSTCKIVYNILRMSSTKKKRTMKELESLQPMTDPVKLKTMKLLDLLFVMAYMSSHESLLPLAVFYGMDYTFRYGLCQYASTFFATGAMLFTAALNDLEGGSIYAHYALEMTKKFPNAKVVKCRTVSCAYTFAMHHRYYAKECIFPLEESFQLGAIQMGYGLSCFDILLAMAHSVYAGRKLLVIEAKLRQVIPIVEQKSQRVLVILTTSLWNSILKLLGRPPVSLKLEAEDFQVPFVRELMKAYTRFDYMYNGNYEVCAESAIETGDACMKAEPGAMQVVIDFCVSALSCLIMLGDSEMTSTKRKRYKKEVRRMRTSISGWIKQGNPNLFHWDALLDAQVAANKAKKQSKMIQGVTNKFEAAVELALKNGYIHDAAVANERWAIFALDVQKDENMASAKMRECVNLNERWGATGKVKKLRHDYEALLKG